MAKEVGKGDAVGVRGSFLESENHLTPTEVMVAQFCTYFQKHRLHMLTR